MRRKQIAVSYLILSACILFRHSTEPFCLTFELKIYGGWKVSRHFKEQVPLKSKEEIMTLEGGSGSTRCDIISISKQIHFIANPNFKIKNKPCRKTSDGGVQLQPKPYVLQWTPGLLTSQRHLCSCAVFDLCLTWVSWVYTRWLITGLCHLF